MQCQIYLNIAEREYLRHSQRIRISEGECNALRIKNQPCGPAGRIPTRWEALGTADRFRFPRVVFQFLAAAYENRQKFVPLYDAGMLLVATKEIYLDTLDADALHPGHLLLAGKETINKIDISPIPLYINFIFLFIIGFD